MHTCKVTVPQLFWFKMYVVEVTGEDYEVAKEQAIAATMCNKELKWRKHWWQIWWPYKILYEG